MNNGKEDTLQKRYGFKLIFSVAIMGINTIIQLLVPRVLSTNIYGIFSYVSNFFSSVISLVDSCTSSALFSKLSKRQSEQKLVKYYLYFSIIIFIILNLFVLVSFFTGTNIYFWNSIPFLFVILGMQLAFWLWFENIVSSISDAYGLTITSEFYKVIQKSMVFLMVACAIFLKRFSLVEFYIIQIVALIILILLLLRIFAYKGKFSIHTCKKISIPDIVSYTKEFYKYCKPLIILACCNSMVSILERWVLQTFSGNLDQAYFGFSNQICMVCFMFASSIMPLLMREFSIYISRNNMSALRILYTKTFKLMYSITAFFSCFIAVNADWMILFSGGEKYLPAVSVLRIMIFYPVHQTIGQINGNMFLAGERTQQYRTVGVTGLLLSVVFNFFLIVPKSYGGLGLGAIGLGLKFVLTQLINTNIATYFNSKYLQISFKKMFMSQIAPIFCFLAIAFGTRILWIVVFDMPAVAVWDNLVALVGTGCVYSALCVVLLLVFPSIIGLDRNFLGSILSKIWNKRET